MLRSNQAREIFRSMDLDRLHPLGVVPPQALRNSSENQQALPHAEADLCDFYFEGRCLNWEARPSECASYFCDEKIAASSEKHKISTFRKYSQENFEFEFLHVQRALKHMGHSLSQISRWADDWNAWALSRKPFRNEWKLSREERLRFYLNQWEWIQSRPFDLSQKRCQVPEA